LAKIRGGDVRQFKIGGRELQIAPESSMELTLPGYQGEYKPSGNGQMAGKGTRVLGAIDGVKAVCKNEDRDHEYITGIRDSMDVQPVTITLIDGTTYSGAMAIEGEVKYTSEDGTATFALRGEKLEQI
jgi:hypothetical protein